MKMNVNYLNNLLLIVEIDLFSLAFPCVFVLCTHKNAETYDLIIGELKSAAEKMNKTFIPSLIMSDYETGVVEVVKQVVSSIYYECLFYF
jgi:hypothetical protein